jgi:hypothetical protein
MFEASWSVESICEPSPKPASVDESEYVLPSGTVELSDSSPESGFSGRLDEVSAQPRQGRKMESESKRESEKCESARQQDRELCFTLTCWFLTKEIPFVDLSVADLLLPVCMVVFTFHQKHLWRSFKMERNN